MNIKNTFLAFAFGLSALMTQAQSKESKSEFTPVPGDYKVPVPQNGFTTRQANTHNKTQKTYIIYERFNNNAVQSVVLIMKDKNNDKAYDLATELVGAKRTESPVGKTGQFVTQAYEDGLFTITSPQTGTQVFVPEMHSTQEFFNSIKQLAFIPEKKKSVKILENN